MATSLTALSAGTTFHENFRIVRELGEGTPMEAQYVAERVVPARTVVLRVLNPKLVAKDKGKSRFGEIAGMRSKVKSEHVVDLLDAGIDKSTGSPWFATPFLEGETLEQYAAEPLDDLDALDVLEQVVHALGALKDAGFVHAALDPAKILLLAGEKTDAPFTVKVNDFWAPAWVRESDEREGVEAGPWAAPETAAHDAKLTAAADVWSLGLIAFRLLTGKAYGAVAADGTAVPASERAEELGFEDDLPDGFDAWFAKCTARAAAERFADADEAFDDLAPMLDDEADEADAGDPPTRGRDDDADEEEDDEDEDDDEEEEEEEAPPPRKAAGKKGPPAKAVVAAPKAKGGKKKKGRASDGPLGALGAYLPEWARGSDAVLPAALILATVFALAVRQLSRPAVNAAAPGAAVGAVGAAPAAAAPAAAAAAGTGAPVVTEIDSRMAEDLVRRLGAAPRGTPAWIAASQLDPGSAARAEQLRVIFQRAGWDPQPVQTFRGTLRPGFFLFGADDSPPTYVTTLSNALRAVGMISNFSSGYRAYYRERLAADPNFVGFPMEANQTFIVAVGRTP